VTGRSCTSTIKIYPLTSCGGTATDNGNPTTSQCVSTTVAGQSYRVTPPALVAGTCTFPFATTTLPPHAFQKVEVACGLAAQTTCAGNAKCITTPEPDQSAFARLCIHKDGDVACPSEDYTARLVGYKKVDDTRACTTCAATPQGGSCGTNYGLRGDTGTCGTKFGASDTLAADTCYAYSGAGTVIDISKSTPGAPTCTPSGGAAAGAATSIEPVTYCCKS
jgi:hypothetical protein